MRNTPFGAISPTGKEVTISGISILRFVDGKIAEIWTVAGDLGMFLQLGLVAQAPPAAAK